ncbi:hypothetical protein NLJ89_g7776 [Agrocybe chaxingu]|uniref:Protein kinase domain-containing protein n=1 Tax=Agrocybe chaxingu TaxID=84603 RepID=A0A9W8JTX8_9AGAR|nr:hypothetical protein NLJ89_g7776 [Agrocybe chaxingu]
MSLPNIPNPQVSIGGTPIVRKIISHPQHTLVADGDRMQWDMANEEMHRWVGPMPSGEFFASYMKLDEDVDLPTVSKTYFDGVPKDKEEAQMYDPLIDLIKAADLVDSKFVFLNTSRHSDPNSLDHNKWRPDISTHKTEDEEYCDPQQRNKTDFDKQQLPWELKVGKLSPFNDPPKTLTKDGRLAHEFETNTDDAHKLRGQLATVLAEMCTRQFRTHAFMVFMNESDVRFIRTDRSGTVVTEAINYRTESGVLAEFLARFARMTDVQRGVDNTVRRATQSEIAVAQKFLADYQATPERSLPWVAIKVPTIDGSVREVITREPVSEPNTLTGRATRAFPVYDLVEKKVMYVKDTWRAALPGMDQEAEILRELNAAEVCHVPRLVEGGDVIGEFHEAHSHTLQDAPWRAGPLADLVPRTHHRFLEDFVGIQLCRFRFPKELLQAVSDAFDAHREALVKCGFLHRDISENNIMIDSDGRGILNDWDMAKRVGRPGEAPPVLSEEAKRHSYRTGTWYYLSSGLLDVPFKLHTLQDDIESFFHVLFYYCLQFVHHNRSDDEVKYIINDVFEESTYDPVLGYHQGGKGKRLMFLIRRHFKPVPFDFPNNRALTDWIRGAHSALRQYYMYLLSKEDGDTDDLPGVSNKPPPFESLAIYDHTYLRNLFATSLAQTTWSRERKGVIIKKRPRPRVTRANAHDRDDCEDLPPTPSKPSKRARTDIEYILPAKTSSQWRRDGKGGNKRCTR